MMTSTQVVETWVNVTTNGPSQDHTHPADHYLTTYDMTPEFKPFTIREKKYAAVEVRPRQAILDFRDFWR